MGRKTVLEKATEKEIDKWDYNWAKNHSVVERFKRDILPIMFEAKRNRLSKEEEWLEDYRLWACQLSDGQMYQGRANLFIPEMNHQIEASVGKYQTALFPNNKYLDCVALRNTTREDAENIKDAVFYELHEKNRLPCLFERYERQKVLFGTSALKVSYKKEMMDMFFRNKKGSPMKTQVPKWRGVKIDVCDMFHTYIFPETIVDKMEAQIEFEEYFAYANDIKKDERFVNTDFSEIEFENGLLQWVDVARLNIQNLSTVSGLRKNQVLLYEGYCNFDLKDDGNLVPIQFFVAQGSNVLMIKRNPNWHQMSPFLWGRYMKGPANEFYGHSLSERLRSLQYMTNDVHNQTMDSMNYALSPVAVIDPGFAGDINSFKVFPGAKWFGSPQGIDFKAFPDVSPTGLQIANSLRGQFDQFSDTALQIAPQLSGKSRTATAASAVVGEMAADQREMIRDDEFSVLVPLCKMTHILLQQYEKEDYIIRIQGERGEWATKEINPEDLVGDVDFIWKGVSYAEQTAVKTQQLLGFFDKAMQLEQMKPGTFDIDELVRKVAKDGFQMDLHEVLLSDKKKFTVSPKIENIILLQGKEAKIHLGDNHEDHIVAHTEAMNEAKNDMQKFAIMKHVQDHKTAQQAQEVADAQETEMAALQQNQMEGNIVSPNGAGNPSQQSEVPTSEGQILQGMRGVEPNV